MGSRQLRDRRYRRVLAAGLGVSIAVHGAVLGLARFEVPATTTESDGDARTEEMRQFDVPAMELVTLETTPSPTVPDPLPEPAGGAARIAIDPTPRAASPASKIDAQLARTMRPDFNTQRKMSSWALRPIQAAGLLNGGRDSEKSDSGEDEESGGESWWQRLGISVGGGGGHCPVPSGPPTVVMGIPPGIVSR